jgi:hypothetical protein
VEEVPHAGGERKIGFSTAEGQEIGQTVGMCKFRPGPKSVGRKEIRSSPVRIRKDSRIGSNGSLSLGERIKRIDDYPLMGVVSRLAKKSEVNQLFNPFGDIGGGLRILPCWLGVCPESRRQGETSSRTERQSWPMCADFIEKAGTVMKAEQIARTDSSGADRDAGKARKGQEIRSQIQYRVRAQKSVSTPA